MRKDCVQCIINQIFKLTKDYFFITLREKQLSELYGGYGGLQ